MKFPVNCPCCESLLKVTELSCDNCKTKVLGQFQLPILGQLAQDEQEFVLQFLKFSGSLKDMASKMGVSYPTVRNKLDDLIEKINRLDK